MQENDLSTILKQLNTAYDGCFGIDAATVRLAEQNFARYQKELERRGITIRENKTSGRWEIIGGRNES